MSTPEDAYTGLVMSGTVLSIQRITEESIRVTVRDTRGLVYDIQFPFSQNTMSRSLPFNVDDQVGISIGKLEQKEV